MNDNYECYFFVFNACNNLSCVNCLLVSSVFLFTSFFIFGLTYENIIMSIEGYFRTFTKFLQVYINHLNEP